MKNLWLGYLIAVILASCGTSEVDVKDSTHTLDGEAKAYQYVIVQFDFITDIRDLCTDLYAIENGLTDLEKKAKVAECTFDYLSVLDTGLITEFTDDYCNDQELYDSLNPEDQARVDELCSIL
jgi:hypothetical protein